MDANRVKSTISPAFGSRSQGVKRPNQVWEMDSFRNDVVCFSPQDQARIYVYRAADLQEYICEAVWREAEQINLAEFARQAQVAYEFLKQEVKQTRKRGQAMLRKIAKEPMSILGQVQEILPLV